MNKTTEALKLADQKKQEPVAIVDEIGKRLDGTYIFNAVSKVDVGQPLYAAPVSAEPCKECDAKQAKIDSLMLEYCPDEITDEQMTEWSANQKPVSECRHCGWLCMPNDSHSKKWYPMQEPVKQEPVAWALSHSLGLEFSSKFPMCKSKERAEELARQHMGQVVVTQLYVAPVSAKREWVDVTDDEIDELIRKWCSPDMGLLDFAWAAIAAFKEKNK